MRTPPSIPPSPAAARRHPVRLAAILLLGVSVSACGGVGPDYQVPSTPVAPFHNAAPTAVGAVAPPLDRWWEGFQDPELTRIIQRALEQNLDLAGALARVRQARAAASAAGAQLLPTADFTPQVAKDRQSLESPTGAIGRHLPGYQRDQTQYDVGAAASWEIDLFGGLRRGEEAANAEAEAAQAAQLGTRVSVAADAADAYFRIRGDQARLAVTRDQIATDAHLLDLVRLRLSRGLATDREEAQAEALLAQARAAVPPLRIDLEAQMNRLDVLMGAQPGTYAAELGGAQGNITAPSVTIPIVAGGDQPGDLLRRRPDIIAAERRLAAANARIGQTVSDYYPKMSLSGLLGFESLDAGHLFRAATFQPQGMLGLRWRLFDFGKVDAEVAQARGATAEALAQYRQSVLRAAEDVEDAFMTLAQTQAHARELQTEVIALTRVRDSSQQAYTGGVIPLTDVLDADRQLLVAQDDLAQSRADTARAAVASFRALGGGWTI